MPGAGREPIDDRLGARRVGRANERASGAARRGASSQAEPGGVHELAKVFLADGDPLGGSGSSGRGETTPMLLGLQRSVGNRAVCDVLSSAPTPGGGDRWLQRAKTGGETASIEKYYEAKLATLKTVPSTQPDPTAATEGSKGQAITSILTDDFVVTGQQGTWHHIYPRNLLKQHLANISGFFVAVSPAAKEGSFGGTAYNAMTTMGSSFSMDKEGKLNKPANYYWKPGNGFLGVRSDYRADDPGQLVEHEKPKSMGKPRYQKPRDWGKGLERLSNYLGDLGEAKDLSAAESEIARLAGIVTGLSQDLDGPAYRSSDVENVDWQRVDDNVNWGQASKNYRLVK